MALLTTIANAQNITGSHQVRVNDEVKKQQVENRSESPGLSEMASKSIRNMTNKLVKEWIEKEK